MSESKKNKREAELCKNFSTLYFWDVMSRMTSLFSIIARRYYGLLRLLVPPPEGLHTHTYVLSYIQLYNSMRTLLFTINFHNIPLPLHPDILHYWTPVFAHPSMVFFRKLVPKSPFIRLPEQHILLLDSLMLLNTIDHSKTLVAWYRTYWRLPWPNLHLQPDNILQNTRLSPVRTCVRRV